MKSCGSLVLVAAVVLPGRNCMVRQLEQVKGR